MPEMLRGADVKRLIVNTAPEVGKQIDLYGIVFVIAALARDEEVAAVLKEAVAGMMDKMPEMMPMMAPLMHELMPKMMTVMAPMMAGPMPDMCSVRGARRTKQRRSKHGCF